MGRCIPLKDLDIDADTIFFRSKQAVRQTKSSQTSSNDANSEWSRSRHDDHKHGKQYKLGEEKQRDERLLHSDIALGLAKAMRVAFYADPH